jgi:hypothetical protein
MLDVCKNQAKSRVALYLSITISGSSQHIKHNFRAHLQVFDKTLKMLPSYYTILYEIELGSINAI